MGALDGMVIAITGKLSIGTRDEIEKIIQLHGGIFATSVTKIVTHLVTNDPDAMTSKLINARKMGIQIFDESFLSSLSMNTMNEIEEPQPKRMKLEIPLFQNQIITIFQTKTTDLSECIDFIEKHGGIYMTELNDKITHLYVDDLTAKSPQLDTAREMNIPILDKAELMKLIYEEMFGIEDDIASPSPKRRMEDGEAITVQGNSNSTYEVRYRNGVYYCTCMGWKMQNRAVDERSCKHLREILGDAFENHRIGDDEPSKTKLKSSKGKKNAPKVLLAQKWEQQDIVGWWISEKYDGVRGYWNGKEFLSRLGNVFHAPEYFTSNLPKDQHLDGELYMGRGMFEQTVSIVKSYQKGPKWKELIFKVFDVPTLKADFETRMEFIKKNYGSCPYVEIVNHEKCTSNDMLNEKLKQLEALGAEGLMLRQPNSMYIGSRSSTLLKVKTFFDDEAIVLGYEKGKGKYIGMTGSLKVKNRQEKSFAVGSGLSDALRKNPPKVGTIITYRYQETTQAGIPRFPTFVGIAIDKEWPKDK